MPRNMSFSLTTQQVRDRTKTVTRRFGWRTLQPGTVVWAVEKAMGLKKGERVVRICPLRIVSNRAEPLARMLDDPAYGDAEAVREGFPDLDGRGFVDFLLRSTRRTADERPQRIEFEYVEPGDDDWPGSSVPTGSSSPSERTSPDALTSPSAMLPTDDPPACGWPAFVRGLLAHTEDRQEDLAKRLCIRRRATISDWQRGDRTPTGPDAIVLKVWAGIVGYVPSD